MNADPERLRVGFVAWQCRIRQHAVRRGDGRPTDGMRPQAAPADGSASMRVTTVLVKADAESAAAQFRQMHYSARSPLERFEAVMQTLQGSWYQDPASFSDRLSALFAAASPGAARLVEAGRCVLDFAQFGQRYTVPATVQTLADEAAAARATYWHNALFNARMPAAVQILSFVPDWPEACAEPPVPGA